MQWLFATTFVVSIALPGVSISAQSTTTTIDYKTEIKPLLKTHCFACHGSLKQESTLRLDSGKSIFKGGEIGPAVITGNSADSLLYQVLTKDADIEMPPAGQGRKLKTEEIQLIKLWIEQGAHFPQNDQPEAAPSDHWAFQPIQRPATPVVKTKAINPIDAFIYKRQEQAGVTAQIKTDKATLLRRVYIDLIGLPPTPEELTAFLHDSRPDAYQRVVEDLLSRPQYGERWGRHWMDVWRYSDWYGRRGAKDMTNSYSLTWRWRDWIIRSLNEDKGYDRMIMEMLAADEIAPNDRENLVATGFIVRNFYRWNYHTWRKDNVEHTGKAFLGLTMNCCECHDHKYDPISQQEYFSFRSFFEPIDLRHDRVPGEADPGIFPDYKLSVRNGPVRTGMVRIYDRHLDAKAKFYTGGLEANIVKEKPPIEAGAIKFLGGDKLPYQKIDLPVTAWYPGLKPFVILEETQTREAAYQKALKAWEQQKPKLKTELSNQETQLANLLKTQETRKKLAQNSTNGKEPMNQQALQLSAKEGRRTLAYDMSGWKTFDTKTQVQFRLRILADKLVNFQLSNELSAGRTNLYVAFDAGKVMTYAPGTTIKTQLGTYATNSGNPQFHVNIQLKQEEDLAILTITDTNNSNIIVDHQPIALNGWNPVNAKNPGIFLDAHSDTIAEFDDIVFLQNGSRELKRFDFEFPSYRQGHDVSGIENWQVTRFSTGKANSQVVLIKPLSAEEKIWQQEFSELTQKRDLTKLKQETLRLNLKSAIKEKEAYAARVFAAKTRYMKKTANFEKSERAASQAEWQANLSQAESSLKSAEHAVLQAKLISNSDKNRAKKLETAQKEFSLAQKKLQVALKPRDQNSTTYTSLSRIFPKQSTGKRAELARWIANRKNPLTARVAVNHIWMRHLGKPLVKSVYNFGRSGTPPTHPDLINWLAAEFMDHNWSIKHLHRQILLSQTYQRSSRGVSPSHQNIKHDRDNLLLWKFPTKRMEAEVVRDSIFYLAENLDLKMYGQEIEQNLGLTTNRRSLYFSHHGEAKMEFLGLFDGASATDCYQRKASIMPQQALALTNSELSVQKSRMIAERLWTELHKKDDQTKTPTVMNENFVRKAFQLILSRSASQKELIAALQFLNRQEQLFLTSKEKPKSKQTTKKNRVPDQPATRARESFVQALFSHNDFVTIR